MTKQHNNSKKNEKSLDEYINMARQKTEQWPEWKRNMFSPAPVRQKTA